jgi:hypothetical protein
LKLQGDENVSDKPFYEELKVIKENGEQLNFNEITYDELYTLWWEEKVNDKQIGALYGVSNRSVAYKRKRLNITQDEMISTELLDNIFFQKQNIPNKDTEK